MKRLDIELTPEQRRTVLTTMTSAMSRAGDTCSGCIAFDRCQADTESHHCWIHIVAAVENHFAHCWGDEPKLVMLRSRRMGDGPYSTTVAHPGEYEALVNPYGAVSVVTADGRCLGLRPGEFEWVESEVDKQPEVKHA